MSEPLPDSHFITFTASGRQVCVTEAVMDAWFAALSPEDKADMYALALEAEPLPEDDLASLALALRVVRDAVAQIRETAARLAIGPTPCTVEVEAMTHECRRGRRRKERA